jgi:hypothetical protein
MVPFTRALVPMPMVPLVPFPRSMALLARLCLVLALRQPRRDIMTTYRLVNRALLPSAQIEGPAWRMASCRFACRSTGRTGPAGSGPLGTPGFTPQVMDEERRREGLTDNVRGPQPFRVRAGSVGKATDRPNWVPLGQLLAVVCREHRIADARLRRAARRRSSLEAEHVQEALREVDTRCQRRSGASPKPKVEIVQPVSTVGVL